MSNSETLTIAALQLPTLGMQATKLDFYLRNAHARGVELVLLGEYVLNLFFKELTQIPIKMVKEQSDKHVELLQKFAIKYQMAFVAPLIVIREEKYIKTIVKITAKEIHYYEQQILIPYEHWNEKKFFNNEIKKIETPLTFSLNGFNIMAMGGFEVHFDPFWEKVTEESIDLLLLPTASTFDSHKRWREIIKTKAFLHGCYLLRANRLGEFEENAITWKFYGDSMLIEPNGEIYMMLEDKESMLIETISKSVIKEHKEQWKFQEALALRAVL